MVKYCEQALIIEKINNRTIFVRAPTWHRYGRDTLLQHKPSHFLIFL